MAGAVRGSAGWAVLPVGYHGPSCYSSGSSGAAGILRLSWDEAWHLMERAVARGKAAKQRRLPALIGVDEKAAAKGHTYLTLVTDLERGCVEYIADERRLSGFLNEIAQTLGCGGEPLEKEGVNGGEARRKLRRIQIPSLVETIDQRVADVIDVQTPRAMDSRAFADRHDVRCAVGEP